jgi:uncharacterized BrkB/YihY/UPF0761 family membrane protein
VGGEIAGSWRGRLRAAWSWLLAWLEISAAICVGLVLVTWAQGGELHRIRVCPPDANVYMTVIVAVMLGLVAVLLYRALGAPSPRSRVARVVGVVVVSVLMLAVAYLIGSAFSAEPYCHAVPGPY